MKHNPRVIPWQGVGYVLGEEWGWPEIPCGGRGGSSDRSSGCPPQRCAQVLDYFCAPNVSSSDHKPVSAVFSVPTIWRRHDVSADVPPGDVRVVISRIAIEGLSVLRKRTASEVANALPNPYVTISVSGKGRALMRGTEGCWGGGSAGVTPTR